MFSYIDITLFLGYALVQIPDLLFAIFDFIENRSSQDNKSSKIRISDAKTKVGIDKGNQEEIDK